MLHAMANGTAARGVNNNNSSGQNSSRRGRQRARGNGNGGGAAAAGGPGGGGGKKKPMQHGMEANVQRTIYICDIDQQVTEEQLASVFADCGSVIDCRVCGDPNSAMRFAFIEFTTKESAAKVCEGIACVFLGCHFCFWCVLIAWHLFHQQLYDTHMQYIATRIHTVTNPPGH